MSNEQISIEPEGPGSDRRQFLCFAIALWNGRDPILKEGHA